MGSCFSEPVKPSRRRRSTCDRRCTPVQYEYYYSIRDGETVLVRRRVELPRRHHHCGTDASSSLNVDMMTSGHRGRYYHGADRKTKSRRKSKSSRYKKEKKKKRGRRDAIRIGAESDDDEDSDHEDDDDDDDDYGSQNQVGFWMGESTKGHNGESVIGNGKETRAESVPEAADDNVSSLHEHDGEDLDVGEQEKS